MSSLRAVLWDMDGTLIDSEPLWRQEQRRLMHSAGLRWAETDANAYVGQSTAVTAEAMRRRGLDMPLEDLVEEVIAAVAARLSQDLPWMPGARALIGALAPLPSALVTMSHRRIAQPLLDAAPVAFGAVVTGDIVARGKPDPEPYVTAAMMLGVEPSECLVIEDSLPGVAAARAAGAVTIGVEGVVSLSGSGAHEVVPTLEGLDAHDLLRIHDRYRRSGSHRLPAGET